MTKTFTLVTENTNLSLEKASLVISQPLESAPSEHVISRILNFSKNIEVKPSRFIKNFNYLKS